MFTHAIVRLPGANFAGGLTTADLGLPIYAKAIDQHARYCAALKRCGLDLIRLPIDLDYPDSTFVEDTAILTNHGAILAHPGARSRRGEVPSVGATLLPFFPQLARIEHPGTLDGGDICAAGHHFFIGISARTNAAGAQQLAAHLAHQGCTSTCIDIRGIPAILHLKSGLSALGDHRLVVIDALADQPAFQGWELVRVDPAEIYAANCVRVNDHLLLAAGFPALRKTVHQLGYSTIELNMSEFQKMDGGLSCLSLRFHR